MQLGFLLYITYACTAASRLPLLLTYREWG